MAGVASRTVYPRHQMESRPVGQQDLAIVRNGSQKGVMESQSTMAGVPVR